MVTVKKVNELSANNMQLARYGHLIAAPLFKIGERGKKGDLLGFVGKTGHANGPHLHFDMPKYLRFWYEYTAGLARDRVAEQYTNPHPFMVNGLPKPNTLPANGYGYLSYTVDHLYHPGVDINSENDEGSPVYAVFDFEVYFATPEDTTGFNDHGWGNCIIIQELVSPQSEIEFRVYQAIKDNPSIGPLLQKDMGLIVNALDQLGYSMQDILNQYTSIHRGKGPIFNLKEHRPKT